jgi:hypothetical protein
MVRPYRAGKTSGGGSVSKYEMIYFYPSPSGTKTTNN